MYMQVYVWVRCISRHLLTILILKNWIFAHKQMRSSVAFLTRQKLFNAACDDILTFSLSILRLSMAKPSYYTSREYTNECTSTAREKLKWKTELERERKRDWSEKARRDLDVRGISFQCSHHFGLYASSVHTYIAFVCNVTVRWRTRQIFRELNIKHLSLFLDSTTKSWCGKRIMLMIEHYLGFFFYYRFGYYSTRYHAKIGIHSQPSSGALNWWCLIFLFAFSATSLAPACWNSSETKNESGNMYYKYGEQIK